MTITDAKKSQYVHRPMGKKNKSLIKGETIPY